MFFIRIYRPRPRGSQKGGMIVAQGTPEDVSKRKEGFTSGYLRKALKESSSN